MMESLDRHVTNLGLLYSSIMKMKIRIVSRNIRIIKEKTYNDNELLGFSSSSNSTPRQPLYTLRPGI